MPSFFFFILIINFYTPMIPMLPPTLGPSGLIPPKTLLSSVGLSRQAGSHHAERPIGTSLTLPLHFLFYFVAGVPPPANFFGSSVPTLYTSFRGDWFGSSSFQPAVLSTYQASCGRASLSPLSRCSHQMLMKTSLPSFSTFDLDAWSARDDQRSS